MNIHQLSLNVDWLIEVFYESSPAEQLLIKKNIKLNVIPFLHLLNERRQEQVRSLLDHGDTSNATNANAIIPYNTDLKKRKRNKNKTKNNAPKKRKNGYK